MGAGIEVREDIQLDVPEFGPVRRRRADYSLEILFSEQYPRVLSVLIRITGDRGRAEELASEVFCRLASRPSLFRPGNNLEGWLYRVAMNCGLNYLKIDARRKRHERAAAVELARSAPVQSTPLEAMLQSERRQRARVTLASLKPEIGRILLLRSAGFSYRELSQILGVNIVSVGKTLLRSRAEFERKYREIYGGKI